MKYRLFVPIILLAVELPFAQLLPQKSEDPSVKIDRALIFKVDYNDDVEAPADSLKINDQPTHTPRKKNLTDSPIFINSLCATGVVFSILADKPAAADCFVLPSKKLK
ncbi:MAG: hypothetical protein IIT53_11660 [Fibrobacter sp.]|nr:hypothetical protein [Fibrobacter sp.]